MFWLNLIQNFLTWKVLVLRKAWRDFWNIVLEYVQRATLRVKIIAYLCLILGIQPSFLILQVQRVSIQKTEQ